MLKLRRISASHRDAFLERYQGLHAWAVQMTANDQALAEDLLHDLFILFTLSQPDLSQIQNLDNYLYASLRNLHISQLRRATRGRFEQLSVVEYESARLSLHSVGHGRDLIQAQDELRRICQYACARKATANAASVLILRFFHGYYPSEIAKVLRNTCEAVHLRLRAARTEAKAYLENSKSLTFLDGQSQPLSPEIFPARFARARGDFLLELQQTIFQLRSGDCLSREELKELYEEAREAFEHKPQELCVSVNGYLLGSQLIGSELSELTLNVTADERISFCEVFSEQGIRLMMMNVEELPPSGPGELRQRIGLSEARTLESALLFSNPFPTLHVTYHDPALAVEAVADTDITESGEIASSHTPQEKRISRLRSSGAIKKLDQPISALRKAVRDQLFNLRFWLRPATITALVTIGLIAAVILLELRQPAPVVTAADLLQRSALAEEALATNPNQVLHRTISFEERAASGDVIARRRIEVWQNASNGLSARRLFDDKGSLIAGDWRRADGVQTLYHHGTRPQIKPVPQTGSGVAALTFENAWQFLPSSKEFTLLVGGSDKVQFEERASEYLLTYARDASMQEGNGLLKASVVLNRNDLHAIEQTFTLRIGNEMREYRMTEASFERRPTSTVAPSVFEPDAELLNSALSRVSPLASESKSDSTSTVVPSRVVATPELEVEVLRLLNLAGADMGEQINVTRTPEGLLQVQGLTQTEKRKRELLNALAPLAGNPAVRLDIQTLDEALANRPKSNLSPDSVTVETTQPSSNTIAVDKELRSYLAARHILEAQMDEAVRQFSDRTLRRSLQILKHAAALKTLAQRFSPEELRTLDPNARTKWLQLIRQHAERLQQESASLRREVSPLFPGVANQTGGEAVDIQNDADLAHAVQRLFQICSENDRAIRLAFSISPDSSSGEAIKGAQFWRSLQAGEGLAAIVSQYRPK